MLGYKLNTIFTPITIDYEKIPKRKIKADKYAVATSKMLDDFRKSELLDELNILHKTGIELVDPSDLSGSLKGRGNLYAHLESMIKNANKSIIMSTTSKGLIRKAEEFARVFKKAKSKGVKIRITAPLTKNNKKVLKELSKYAEVRHTDDRARFMVVDGKQATLGTANIDYRSIFINYELNLFRIIVPIKE